MPILEKKLSDFQVSECESQVEQLNVIDSKLCPTCIPDDSFVAPIWFNEQDPYLDKSTCEYVTRVYTSELEKRVSQYKDRFELDEAVKKLGVTKILQHFDKPLNNSIRDRVLISSYYTETYQNTETISLGIAYKVCCPAFNLDQVQQDEEDEDEQTKNEPATTLEFILDGEGLNRKLFQLRNALVTYQFYYASARAVSKDFVIRQEDDILARINYNDAITRIKKFKMHLNDVLEQQGYAKIGHIGAFKKRILKFKFLFKKGQTNYSLKEIWVLPDDSCDAYVKLRIGKNNALKKEPMAIVYHFMKNIDKMIKDITARETKPWLEFTLEHFYPNYIADYGDIQSIEESRSGLGCIIEKNLGLEPGKIVDSLTDEIMSAFNVLGDEFGKSACRSIGNLEDEGPTGQKIEENKTKKASRQEQLTTSYRKEYENKFYKQAIEQINSNLEKELNEKKTKILNNSSNSDERKRYFIEKLIAQYDEKKVSKEDLFDKIKDMEEYSNGFPFIEPSLQVRKDKDAPLGTNIPNILNEDELSQLSIAWASLKFSLKESGNMRDQIGNSPHYQEMLDAKEELFKKFETTYIDGVKEVFKGERETEPIDFIHSIGLCGVSKIAGTALKCILNGVKLEDFTAIIIEKFFEFVNLNTFSLFFNGLPSNFRSKFSETFRKEFGSDMNLEELFGVVLEMNKESKLSEVTKAKKSSRAVAKIYQKSQNPRILFEKGSNEIRTLAASFMMTEDQFLAGNAFDSAILLSRNNLGYDMQNKSWPEGEIMYDSTKPEKTMKREKVFHRDIKAQMKEAKLASPDFKSAKDRFKSSMKTVGSEINDLIGEVTDTVSQTYDTITNWSDEKKRLKEEIESIEADMSRNSDRLRNVTTQIMSLGKIPSNQQTDDQKSELDRLRIELSLENEDYLDLSRQKKEKERRLEEITLGLDDVKAAASNINNSISEQIITTNEANNDPAQLSKIEKAANNFIETTLGVKVDLLFDLVFDLIVDEIMDFFSTDELIGMINKYPIADFLINSVKDFFQNTCPVEPIFVPAVKDFMKGLTLDVCDLKSSSLKLPVIVVPSINWKFILETEFGEIFREAIIKVATDLIINLITKLMSLLESSLCNLTEALAKSAAGAIADGGLSNLKNSFLDALNEAFCNDGDDPDDSRRKAEQLADAIFAPIMNSNSDIDLNRDYSGSGAKIANVISSVATTREILEIIVNPSDRSNPQTTGMISNAINILAPEANILMGDAAAVEAFFANLGSYLSPEDKNAIREMLEFDLPTTPISSAICLTNDQLNRWNELRASLLSQPGRSLDEGWVQPGSLPSQGSGLGDPGLGGFGFGSPSRIVDDLNQLTLDVLGDLVDSISDLSSPDGPFIGAATNEAIKDVCNPKNVFNDVSQPKFEKDIENESVDSSYSNIMRTLMWGFTFKGGLFAEALRDREGNAEFSRRFYKLFNPNYGNSTQEQVLKFSNKGAFGQLRMNFLNFSGETVEDAPKVIGDFPETVAIMQRKELLETEEGRSYDIGAEKQKSGYFYTEGSEEDPFMYKLSVKSDGLNSTPSFDYKLKVLEEVFEDKALVPSFLEETNVEIITESDVEVPISKEEQDYIDQYIGTQFGSSVTNFKRYSFNKILKNKSGLQIDFRPIYDDYYEIFNKEVSTALLTNPTASDGLPIGYKFGYVDDKLTKESFEYYNPEPPDSTTKYNLPESEKTLGRFNSTRIKALDPAIYGGRYSNPPFYVEPRKFSGWLEIATKAFESLEGCDPKKPPLFDFTDIKDRVKNLNSSIKNDPRLSKPRDCIKLKPFNLLVDSKTKASLDGIVRTTIRSYLVEYYVKGYGLLSNLQYRTDNFDNSIGIYISNKIKKEMSELGTSFSNKKIRIVRERYWYTFLEQVVETYFRMVDIDKVIPPIHIKEAMNRIQIGMDAYTPITSQLRKKMRKNIPSNGIKKPGPIFDQLEIINNPVTLALQSVAFRLTPTDEKDDFFNGEYFTNIQPNDIRFASIKKLNFFQTVYFIALFEKDALLIMSEFIKEEMQRVSDILVDGVNDKPYYYDLNKSLFSISSLFANSTSRVGLSEFYLEKQNANINTGTVQNVPSDNTIVPGGISSEPRLILEKYVRLNDKNSAPVTALTTRPSNLRGVVSILDFESFIDENLEELEDYNLSDLFGNLQFSYKEKIGKVFENGFINSYSINRIKELNPNMIDDINNAIKAYTELKLANKIDKEKEAALDKEVILDSTLIPEGSKIEPTGTLGSIGVRAGLRISLVLPENYIDLEQLQQNTTLYSNLLQKSISEKSFVFSDGGFSIPIMNSEIDVLDSTFEQFRLTSGPNQYDLECLINKMSSSAEFKIFFEKILDLKQISSMVAVYCMESLPASIGRDETEREEVKDDPDVDSWDRTVNKFAKNYLRKEFKSRYLSSTEDVDDDDDDELSFANLFQFSNPFDFQISIKIPWWKLRRQKFKIYDANSMECADPKKDLQ